MTGVLDAVVHGADPMAALTVDHATVTDWPWAPALVTASLAELDADLARRHANLIGAAKPRRPPRRSRRADVVEEAKPRVEHDAEKLTSYAAGLAAVLEGGTLTRLLLRNEPEHRGGDS